jgi:hypothetical protein
MSAALDGPLTPGLAVREPVGNDCLSTHKTIEFGVSECMRPLAGSEMDWIANGSDNE